MIWCDMLKTHNVFALTLKRWRISTLVSKGDALLGHFFFFENIIRMFSSLESYPIISDFYSTETNPLYHVKHAFIEQSYKTLNDIFITSWWLFIFIFNVFTFDWSLYLSFYLLCDEILIKLCTIIICCEQLFVYHIKINDIDILQKKILQINFIQYSIHFSHSVP